MKSLIIPAAGLSKRFPNMKPKWMLTHPSGNMMFVEAVAGIDLNEFDKIYLVTLKQILDENIGSREGIKDNFYFKYKKEINIVELEQQTRSQSETVFMCVTKENIKGAALVKDSDGNFVANNFINNSLAFCSLSDYDLKKSENKSYITFDDNNKIVNIVEKQIISKNFCVGGYFFENISEFVETYKKLQSLEQISELYISTIINDLLLNNKSFEAKHVLQYKDWGTLQDWQEFVSNYATYFFDIDGVLFKNSSKYFIPKWGESEPIDKNVQLIKNLFNTGTNQIIITTSRSEDYKDITINQLNNLGIKYHKIIFGLQHCKRIIINDYFDTNPYPSCEAINLERNSDKLDKMLRIK